MMEWRTGRPVSNVTGMASRPITGITDIVLPGPFPIRILLWLLIFATFPLSVTAARLSFNLEVRGRTPYAALPPECRVDLSERVLARLEKAEQKEFDPSFRDDIRIAWITTLYASQGNPQAHIDATYRVLGKHPDKVWPAILAQREALLGPEFLPHNKKQPMAANRDGDAPQKTCAYGAQKVSLVGLKRDELTGSSCRTVTKHEARRIRTSEFGHNATPAGVAAPAANTPPKKKSKSVRNLTQKGVA